MDTTIWVHVDQDHQDTTSTDDDAMSIIQEESRFDTEQCGKIAQLELIDPPLFGGSYTWRGGKNYRNASRIDKFLYSFPWDEMFTRIKQSSLPSLGSDHNPILLTCGDDNFKKSYFKFAKWWLNVEGFKEKVQEWWCSFIISGTPDYILATKLSMLKAKLKEWSKEHKVNRKARKSHILDQIGSLETLQESRPLNDDEQLVKVHLAMEYEEVARNEEIFWRQKSRVQWIKCGDKNTKFFHRTAHKRLNTIDSLLINGELSSDPVAIKGSIVDFYQDLYKESENWRPYLNLYEVQGISTEERNNLERAFEEEEVLAGIKMCAAEKAPRPDGYTMAFFQAFWETIKEELMQTFHRFHSHHKFEKSFNATFVALIPKKVGANDLRDFRPISLIYGVYKIIAKVLAERLKKVISRVVNNHQMAFIKGRQIMDASLIASECIDTTIRGDVQIGFGRRWIKWIEFCIKTRGLRQGDPLSPFLFIIAMEGLGSLMRRAATNNWIKGFSIKNRNNEIMEVTHLLFADDTVVFCEAEQEQICYLRVIRVIFEACSGLKINWRKINIFPVKEVQQIQSLAHILRCRIKELPTIYLGMPLGANHKAVNLWDGIIEKTEKRLALWKSQYLSLGGRVVLINSVLDSLPTYVMSLFPIPGEVVKILDKLRRDFLWQGSKIEKSFNLVKWSAV
ncbi:hypothetical protein MTR67_014122 [Solanum verrucosum]|uniref:Reverse transcriptase domain-containing protein n=1 Tax=Solanum verrucosum TaxID=315347 RepID=A0AAF0THI5_SOLVR|nr:hypothetical protein MTR67_014122 [Solanum verrucosum]